MSQLGSHGADYSNAIALSPHLKLDKPRIIEAGQERGLMPGPVIEDGLIIPNTP